MMNKMQKNRDREKKTALICACASRSFIPKEKVASLAAVLKQADYTVKIEADLCRRAMRPAEEEAVDLLFACHERAVRALLAWQGVEAGKLVNLREGSSEELLAQAGLACPASPADLPGAADYLRQIAGFPREEGCDAWYPVIDKSRCSACGKCHDFCLFGVYAIEGRVVQVVQPQNCKNNCPACARICPKRAIIFPKYDKSPINGGEAEEETFDPQAMDAMYRERLRYKLQQRRERGSLLKMKGGRP
jgi:NAD-dependent dihydropyrimidine dehydrogenase PreA subunit